MPIDFSKLLPMNSRPEYAFLHPQGTVPPSLANIANQTQNNEQAQLTAKDVIAPYYGDQYEQENRKAEEYLNREFPFQRTVIQPDWLGRLLGSKDSVYTSENYRPDVPEEFLSLLKNTSVQRQMPHVVHNAADGFEHHIDSNVYVNKAGTRTPMESGSRVSMSTNDPQKNYLASLEHELGHATSSGDGGPMLKSGLHLSKPRELENGLGKITRENYLLTGNRFDENTLDKYMTEQMLLPVETRYKGFSPEALRVWEVLEKSFTSSDVEENKLFQKSKKLIPAFVQNEHPMARQLFG